MDAPVGWRHIRFERTPDSVRIVSKRPPRYERGYRFLEIGYGLVGLLAIPLVGVFILLAGVLCLDEQWAIDALFHALWVLSVLVALMAVSTVFDVHTVEVGRVSGLVHQTAETPYRSQSTEDCYLSICRTRFFGLWRSVRRFRPADISQIFVAPVLVTVSYGRHSTQEYTRYVVNLEPRERSSFSLTFEVWTRPLAEFLAHALHHHLGLDDASARAWAMPDVWNLLAEDQFALEGEALGWPRRQR